MVCPTLHIDIVLTIYLQKNEKAKATKNGKTGKGGDSRGA